MNDTFGFKKLEIYQVAKQLVILTYEITRQLPPEERFALVQQMNRAAISIPSNIAEGYSRHSKKDKIHFLNVAYGSLMELICQSEIVVELQYLDENCLKDFSKQAKNLAVKISNFAQYLKGEMEEDGK